MPTSSFPKMQVKFKGKEMLLAQHDYKKKHYFFKMQYEKIMSSDTKSEEWRAITLRFPRWNSRSRPVCSPGCPPISVHTSPPRSVRSYAIVFLFSVLLIGYLKLTIFYNHSQHLYYYFTRESPQFCIAAYFDEEYFFLFILFLAGKTN